MDDNNIFLLREPWRTISKQPKTYDKVKKEIITLLKNNNFSISYAAALFQGIIDELGNTPMNKL